MTKIDKSTMQGILTYEKEDDDDIYDIFAKQICCIKRAAFLLDKVAEIHKKEIIMLSQQAATSETNILTFGETINHILERLKKLECHKA